MMGPRITTPFEFRWLFFDFIPPSFSIDPAERREIRKTVKNDETLLWSKQALVRTLAALPALLVVLGVTYWLYQLGLSSRRMGLFVLADVFLGVFAYVIGVATYAPLRARQTFRAMHLRGFEICTSCGYSLENLSDSSRVCLECGASPPSLNETKPTPPPVHKRRSRTLPPSGLAQWSARPSSEDDSDAPTAGSRVAPSE